MKRKDVVYLALAIGIFLVAGYLAYTQLNPKRGANAKGVPVETVGTIPGQLDSEGMAWLGNSTKVHDYNLPIDMSGLNNTAPFGP